MKIKREDHNLLISAWREQVMQSNKNKCVHCGDRAEAAHHVYSRGASSWVMAYDIRNGVPLCTLHHTDFHNGSTAVANSVKKALSSRGIDIEELKRKSVSATKLTQEAVEEMKERMCVTGFVG